MSANAVVGEQRGRADSAIPRMEGCGYWRLPTGSDRMTNASVAQAGHLPVQAMATFIPATSSPSMRAPRLENRPLAAPCRLPFAASPALAAVDMQALRDALQQGRSPASGQRWVLAAAALLLMDPAAPLHPTLHDLLKDCVNLYLRQHGAVPWLPFDPDTFETTLESLSPSQRADLWAARPAGVEDPALALWQQCCLHAQGLLIQHARHLLRDDALSADARLRLHALVPANAGTDEHVAMRTAGAETALRALDRQCAVQLESLQQLDRQLHWREWTQALPAMLATQAVNRALLRLLPPATLFRALLALSGLYGESSGPLAIGETAAAVVARATSPSEVLAAVNSVLEKGLLTPVLVLHAAASIAVSPMGAAAMLLIGAVACGVQDGVMMHLLQRTGVPRSEAGQCLVEAQRLQANGLSAWSTLEVAVGPWRSVMATVFEQAGGIDAEKARIDAIDDIHRLFQGSLLDEERRAAASRDHTTRLQAIDASLQDADAVDTHVIRQERARLQLGLSLLEALPATPEELLRALDALHDVRGQRVSMRSSAGRGTWPGWLVKWMPACLLGVRNVLPHTLQDTAAARFIQTGATAASTTVAPAARVRPNLACGMIRRNPIVATGAAATAIITGLAGITLVSQAGRSDDALDAGDVPVAQARVMGPYSPEGQVADGSSPLCIGIYLHDDLLPTDTRMEEIHRKYFSWLLSDLKKVFPGKHVYFHYMKNVPGITDMKYRTWFDDIRSLSTFYVRATTHRMGGAIPFNVVQKYLLMTESAPSLLAAGVSMRYAAIAANNHYVVPAHEIGHMLDAGHEYSSVHYNGWWCETNMGEGALNLLRSSCYVFSAENSKRMRAHQKDWRNSPLL